MRLADHTAKKAALDPAVKKFRDGVLHGALLSEDQARRFVLAGTPDKDHPLVGRMSLAFPGADGWVQRIAAARDSPLAELSEVATRLQKDYGWADYQSTWFILTGQTPLPWPIDVEEVVMEDHPVAIRIAVAPWMPGQIVLEAFLRMQRSLATANSRPLSERRQALVVFFSDEPAGSYRVKLERWNQRFPRWCYTDVRRFVRDLKAAHRQMEASRFRLDLAWD
jgi:hypothetical protein